ncbi:LysR family transcriptional regulator [Limosilactobacillus equigenerosi]|uniref:Transcriptional regulator n=1 Tax=Limosilactobacillus equigenerosi DSM 18793 = JCM 14505 TaxID=1423742 RepID=A0A0R1UJY1_9LACO|nr:LysR family transcriptional regulator [Limosilactobacillus equigenerosi]KRL93612.1 transcriptional regulator [Limosilactobacillus equigenerosi DSM 18793 = JCM 14505]
MKDPATLLNYFQALLKYSNFTHAARALYVSQPYLTKVVKQVEQDLKTPVLNRDHIPFQLTPAGEMYIQHLEKLQHEQLTFNDQLTRLTSDQAVIRIGIWSSLGSFLLPKLLPPFLQANSNIKIQLIEGTPRESEARLLSHQIDVYLGQTPATLNQQLTIYPNGQENYYLVIPSTSEFFQPNHFILDPTTVDLKQLFQAPLILTTSESAIRQQINSLLQAYKIVPNIVLTTNNIITATNLAVHGMGLTVSAASILKRLPPTPLNLIPLDATKVQLKYFLALNPQATITPELQALVKQFQALDLATQIH